MFEDSIWPSPVSNWATQTPHYTLAEFRKGDRYQTTCRLAGAYNLCTLHLFMSTHRTYVLSFYALSQKNLKLAPEMGAETLYMPVNVPDVPFFT